MSSDQSAQPPPERILDPILAAAEQEPAVAPEQEPELALIRSELAQLRAQAQALNAILDRLHEENARLRRGETEQLLQPLLRDLIKLSDDWTAMAASWVVRESATPADVATKCREVADDADLILARYGAQRFAPDPGAPFERRAHRAVGSVPAADPALEGTVAQVRRPGYWYGDKVIRFAEVVVHAGGR